MRKELAGRYNQFLSGHAAVGSYLHDKICKVDSDECWWCNTGERQSRFHLVTRCRAWAPQVQVMWKRIEKMRGCKRPRALSMRAMSGDDRATLAVLTFLRNTRVGRVISTAPPRTRGGEGEEGGPGPP